MFSKKKSPKRLYYPTRSRWYNKPRRSKKRVSAVRKKSVISVYWKKMGKWAKKSVYIVLGLILTSILVLFFSFSTYFSISDIKIERESIYVDSQATLSHLNQYIGENLLFFPRQQVVEVVQAHFPEFSSVGVSKFLPGTLTIKLQTHPLVANIRAYYVLPKPEKSPLFVTDQNHSDVEKSLKEAFILEKIEEEGPPQPVEQKGLLNQVGQILFDQEENLELITITINDLTQPLEDRQKLISSDHMEILSQVIPYFENNLSLTVNALEYLPIAREIHLKVNDGTVIWLSLERNYEKQIDKLSAIYKEMELDKEIIDYIDLRVNEKVIYCPAEAACDR